VSGFSKPPKNKISEKTSRAVDELFNTPGQAEGRDGAFRDFAKGA
jgi:hypothetical protein